MTTLNLAVSASADDAEQIATGENNTSGTTLGQSLDSTSEYVGLRFQAVTIANAETINSATLTVEPTGTGEDEPLVTIQGHATDDAGAFTSADNHISGRTRTTASVTWDSTNLGADGNSRHAAPDLATVIQEIVNRAGWVSGNDLALIIRGGATSTRDLTIKSYDSSSADAATLDIDYTSASSFVPRLSLLGVG